MSPALPGSSILGLVQGGGTGSGVGREGSDFSVLQERASPGMRKPKHSPCSIFSGTDSGEILPSSRKTSALRQGLEKGRLMRGHKPE